MDPVPEPPTAELRGEAHRELPKDHGARVRTLGLWPGHEPAPIERSRGEEGPRP